MENLVYLLHMLVYIPCFESFQIDRHNCKHVPVVVHEVDEKMDYFKWKEVCKPDPEFQSKEEILSLTKFNKTSFELIKKCLEEWQRKNKARKNTTFKFWLGLRCENGTKIWKWEKDGTIRSTNRQQDDTVCNEEEDECTIMENNDGEWKSGIIHCNENVHGYLCEKPRTKDLQHNMSETKAMKTETNTQTAAEMTKQPNQTTTTTKPPEICCKTDSTDMKKHIKDLTSQELKNHIKQQLEKALAKQYYNVSNAVKLLVKIEEIGHELTERGCSIEVQSLRRIMQLLHSILPLKADQQLYLQSVKEFLQAYINIAGLALHKINAASWNNLSKTSGENPIQIAKTINNCILFLKKNTTDAESLMFYQNNVIDVHVRKILGNDHALLRSNTTADVKMVETKTLNKYKNAFSISITFHSLSWILHYMKQQQNQGHLNSKTLQLQDENKQKQFIPESTLISYSVYENRQKKSVPVIYTILTNRKPKGRLSCEFYNTSSHSWSDVGCTFLQTNGSRVTCFCNHTTVFAVLLVTGDTKDIISKGMPCHQTVTINILEYTTNSLSVFFLSLTIMSFVILRKKLQGAGSERLVSHFNLSVAMLGLYLCMLTKDIAPLSHWGCVQSTLATHYFILSTFSWMTVEGLLLNLYIVKGNMKNSTLGWKKFVIGWIVPVIVSIITLIIGLLQGEYYYTHHKYTEKQVCLLTNVKGLDWAIAGYVLSALVINSFFLLRVTSVIVKLSRDTKRYQPAGNHNKKQTENTAKASNSNLKVPVTVFKAFLKLYPILGLTWTMGWILNFFPLPTECNAQGITFLLFVVLHTVLNGLQGVYIFIVCLVHDKQIRLALKQKLRDIQSQLLLKKQVTSSDSSGFKKGFISVP
ncbi:uncharacterized protein LOC143450885 isoform X2 [Clavelina lepadiformis]|uniref:uncharacterized protein LOC143450885 isoform X2 n=1 Tax=Clavelina lepadiformis TaxID=159417 RepID=UPI0040429864